MGYRRLGRASRTEVLRENLGAPDVLPVLTDDVVARAGESTKGV
jgi:hypothetical protein